MEITPIESAKLLPSIHPAYLRLVGMQLINMGYSPDVLFDGQRFNWDELIEQHEYLSFEQFHSWYQHADKVSGDIHLPIEISSVIQVSAHGVLGYGALAANCLADAFILIEQMMVSRLGFINLELVQSDERSEVRIDYDFDIGDLKEFLPTTLLGSFLDIIDKSLNEIPTEIEVNMPFERPVWSDQFAQRYPTISVSYGHEYFSLSLSNELIYKPSLTADEFAYRSALQEGKQIISQAGSEGNLTRKVQKALLDSQPDFPSQEHLASEYGMSVRTFIRHLKSEGTNYQKILDEVRKEMAVWFLRDPSLSVDQVAEKLGYQDTSNFSRVFKRWFNQTPSAYRKNN